MITWPGGPPHPPGSLTQDWAPALEYWRTSSLTSPALLLTAGKQEKVMMFEFLQFAFNSFPPPLRSSLRTSSVFRGYSLNLSLQFSGRRLQSSEQTERRMFALGIFDHFILSNDRRRKGFAHKLYIVMQRENVVKQNRFKKLLIVF